MINKVNNLEKLTQIIKEGKPVEVLFDLGKGEKRTELLVTYLEDSIKISDRIASPPLIKLCLADSGVSIDIEDSDKHLDRYSYRNLRPQRTVFEQPT